VNGVRGPRGDDGPKREVRLTRTRVLVLLLVPVLALGLTLHDADQGTTGTLPRLHQPGPPPSEPLGRPDIVLVVTDDQRVWSLDRMSHVQDLLVARGRTYSQAMVPTSLCCPSRASLLTGRYSHDTGVWSNAGPNGGWSAFHENGNEEHTLAVALHEQGYRTALVGKYLNSFATGTPEGYRPPGWDEFTAFRMVDRSGSYYGYRLSDGTLHGFSPADYSTDVFADRAVDFVRGTPSSTNLFLYLAPYAPHSPYTPAPRHAGAWRHLPRFESPAIGEDVSDKPLWVRQRGHKTARQIRHVQVSQQESLMAVDEAVARLIAALQETGRLENTLFVFTSDNGLPWGEHNLMYKSVPYTEATAVPLVVRWDALVPPGEVDTRLALNVDIATTIARATSASMLTAGLDLLGDRQRRGFVLEAPPETHLTRPAYCGWRTADWSYTRYATGEEELYSQERDPYQLTNVARRPENAVLLTAMRNEARRHCSPPPPDFSW
jgi:N-acetylglucosamine-6-sulfatase